MPDLWDAPTAVHALGPEWLPHLYGDLELPPAARPRWQLLAAGVLAVLAASALAFGLGWWLA